MARKNLLAGLTAEKLTAVNSDVTPAPVKTMPLALAGRGALGAVTRSIDHLAARAQAAQELEARLTAGQAIVELDTASIDPSFVSDRMAPDEEAHARLREAVASQGQISPILVRPHPSAQGRYQVAFGHRRLRVAIELQRPVRAVVKELSDRELILAQGQENSARTDLSFIERARFAAKLESEGYDRETIMSALVVDKTTVSRMISAATRVPQPIIEAIGPAPGVGRDRWIELSALFGSAPVPASVAAIITSSDFRDVESDDRFAQVQAALLNPDPQEPPGSEPAAARKRAAPTTRIWADREGAPVVKLAVTPRAEVFTVDARRAPGFAEFLFGRMEELFEDYRSGSAPMGKKGRKR